MSSRFPKKASTRDKTQKTLWILVGSSTLLLIVYASTTFNYPFKRAIMHTGLGDELVHLLSYGLIMFCFCRSWKANRIQIIIGSGLIALGIGLESLQIAMGDDESMKFEFNDIFANALGIVVGYVLASLKK